jgi:hypothetical protein
MNELIKELLLAEASYKYEPNTVNLKLYLIALMKLNLPIPYHFMKPLLDAVEVKKSEIRKAATADKHAKILADVVVSNKINKLNLEMCFESASKRFKGYNYETIASIYKKEKRMRKSLQELLEKYRPP